MFDQYLRAPFGAFSESWGASAIFDPSINIVETEADVTVQAEIPGVEPDDLDITVTTNRLTIAGEKRESLDRKQNHFFQRETRHGKFVRAISLPSTVDTQQVTAEHKNGVLTVRMRKVESAAGRKVSVQSSGPADPTVQPFGNPQGL